MSEQSDNSIALHFTEIIDGVEVQLQKGLDSTKLTFPDGTVSIHRDDGRIITLNADGGMDVIDPEDNHFAHHSAEELAIDAVGLEVVFRAQMPHPGDNNSFKLS